ncbi:hypothetical protein, partial [Xanthomonas fragariae]|uniref:hypothetical protein n=2 Tax=Xanthomonas fragariae TaxID=48664 RepID=UPI001F2D1965
SPNDANVDAIVDEFFDALEPPVRQSRAWTFGRLTSACDDPNAEPIQAVLYPNVKRFKHIPSHVLMFPHDFAVSEGGLAKNWLHQPVSGKTTSTQECALFRPIQPSSPMT